MSPPVPGAARRAPAAVLLGLLHQLLCAGVAAPDSVAADPPMPSVHRFSVRALVAVDVTGRLVVTGHQGAAEAITGVITRLSGILLGHRPDPAVPRGVVIELLVPKAGYPAFARDVAQLGEWVVERQVVDLPDPVRIVVHVSQ